MSPGDFQRFGPPTGKLRDCRRHGVDSGAELFIVEGDSAAGAVHLARDPEFQAVLAWQGKPANALRAPAAKIGANPHYAALIEALGAGWGPDFRLDARRFQRVLLLMDPDADGLHCGALALIFLHRWMRPLLAGGYVETVWAPRVELHFPGETEPTYAYHDAHYHRLRDEFRRQGRTNFETVHHRGLASIPGAALRKTCLQPATRVSSVMSVAEAEAAGQTFAGVQPLELWVSAEKNTAADPRG